MKTFDQLVKEALEEPPETIYSVSMYLYKHASDGRPKRPPMEIRYYADDESPPFAVFQFIPHRMAYFKYKLPMENFGTLRETKKDLNAHPELRGVWKIQKLTRQEFDTWVLQNVM